MKWIAIVLLSLITLFLVVGLALPTNYEVERSVVIDATTEQIHNLVGDLERWDDWTPWKDVDPTVTVTLGDKTTGVGANQSWTDKEGGGRLTFTKSAADSGIAYDMVFLMGKGDAPKEIPSTGAIAYQKVDDGVEVTWSMNGRMSMPVIGGYLALMLPKQIGGMFEAGLTKLEKAAEAEPLPRPESTPEMEPTMDADEVDAAVEPASPPAG